MADSKTIEDLLRDNAASLGRLEERSKHAATKTDLHTAFEKHILELHPRDTKTDLAQEIGEEIGEQLKKSADKRLTETQAKILKVVLALLTLAGSALSGYFAS